MIVSSPLYIFHLHSGRGADPDLGAVGHRDLRAVQGAVGRGLLPHRPRARLQEGRRRRHHLRPRTGSESHSNCKLKLKLKLNLRVENRNSTIVKCEVCLLSRQHPFEIHDSDLW